MKNRNLKKKSFFQLTTKIKIKNSKSKIQNQKLESFVLRLLDGLWNNRLVAFDK